MLGRVGVKWVVHLCVALVATVLSNVALGVATTTTIAVSPSTLPYHSPTSVTLTSTTTKNGGGGAVAAGTTITFSDGVTTLGTAATTASGTASITIRIDAAGFNLAVGSYSFNASYPGAGSSTASASAATNNLTITADATPPTTTATFSPSSPDGTNGWYKQAVTAAYTATVDTESGLSIQVSGKLTKSSDSTPISGRVLLATVNGVAAGTGTTGADGSVTFTYLLPTNTPAGACKVVVSFAGNTTYVASSAYGTFNVAGEFATQMATNSPSGTPGYTTTLIGSLTRKATSGAVAGATLTFKIDGTPVGTATTGADGSATYTYTVPAGTAVGTHSFRAEFAGNSQYQASVRDNTLTVTQQAATTMFCASFNKPVGNTVKLYCYIWNKLTGAMLAGKTVSFRVNGSVVGTAVSNSTGYSQATYTIGAGDNSVRAEFAGDATAVAAYASGTISSP